MLKPPRGVYEKKEEIVIEITDRYIGKGYKL